MNRVERRAAKKRVTREVSQRVHRAQLGAARRQREAEALQRRLSRMSGATLAAFDRKVRAATRSEPGDTHDPALD